MHTRTRAYMHARTRVRTHAYTHARTHASHTQPSPPSPSAAQSIAIHRRPAMIASSAGIYRGVPFIAGNRVIEINNTRKPPEFPDNVEVFRVYKNCVTGCTSGGYDQLETSPETIDQELRPAVCERRQTDL